MANSDESTALKAAEQKQTEAEEKDLPTNINIAVSSRALFKLEYEHRIFEKEKVHKYVKYQMEHENEILEKGTAFSFIEVLKHINDCLKQISDPPPTKFRVILMSHNNAQAGVRLIKSILHHDLDTLVEGGCLSDGTNMVQYLKAYSVDLFLTAYASEAKQAIEQGTAAAALFDQHIEATKEDQLRIAFDLDCVIFSDEADKFYQKKGLEAYNKREQELANTPIGKGPFQYFAHLIGVLTNMFTKHEHKFQKKNPIRTYAVTARGCAVGERVIKTFRLWNLQIDEMHFLCGEPKGPLLKEINPHIFFDDSKRNIESAQSVGTPAAHVPT